MPLTQYADRQHTSWKYCFSLDVAKFVCALLVIIIHTRPFTGLSDVIDFYLVDVIARIAVPLFFAISGYFFSMVCAIKTEKFLTAQKIVQSYLSI